VIDKREQLIAIMATTGPLEPAVLASAEPLPSPPTPLRPGQPVRRTLPSGRKRYGIVVSVGWRMVGVLDERDHTIGYHFPEELVPVKRSRADRLERANKRLRRLIGALMEARRLAYECSYASGPGADASSLDAWQAAEAWLATLLKPYEREKSK